MPWTPTVLRRSSKYLWKPSLEIFHAALRPTTFEGFMRSRTGKRWWQRKMFCHYRTCYLQVISGYPGSITQSCWAHFVDGKMQPLPHLWKATTLVFKVVSFASGPKRESRSSGKSPALGRNGSSGSSLVFCKDFRTVFERTNPKNEHSFKHVSLSYVGKCAACESPRHSWAHLLPP